MKAVGKEVKEARACAVEAEVPGICLGCFIVQPSPDIVGIVTINLSFPHAIGDDDTYEKLVLLDEAQNFITEVCFADGLHAASSITRVPASCSNYPLPRIVMRPCI